MPLFAPETRDSSAIRQVDDHRRIVCLPRPSGQPCLPGDDVHWAARVKTTGQRSSGVEAVPLVVKSASAPAGIDMRFEDGHIAARFGQDSGRGQPTDPGSDNDNPVHANNLRDGEAARSR